ncbi:MAG TPA: hypothetical protein VL737_01760 [Candidatus Pristimantibacillus sp.]|nr:hypothetical protein [Candidatus Pristimantibacillus sp.]
MSIFGSFFGECRRDPTPAEAARAALLERFESYEEFGRIVGQISLRREDVFVPMQAPARRKLPRGWQRFTLAPVQTWITASDELLHLRPSGLDLPPYYYQDQRNAIALVDEGTGICAAAGANLDEQGRVLIGQLQGYDRDQARGPLRSGIIKWRPSLVRAWMDAAREFGADTLGIQSSENDPHAASVGSRELMREMGFEAFVQYETEQPFEALARARELGQQALYPLYDGVADDMGFTRDEANRNWYLPLAAVS